MRLLLVVCVMFCLLLFVCWLLVLFVFMCVICVVSFVFEFCFVASCFCCLLLLDVVAVF